MSKVLPEWTRHQQVVLDYTPTEAVVIPIAVAVFVSGRYLMPGTDFTIVKYGQDYEITLMSPVRNSRDLTVQVSGRSDKVYVISTYATGATIHERERDIYSRT